MGETRVFGGNEGVWGKWGVWEEMGVHGGNGVRGGVCCIEVGWD